MLTLLIVRLECDECDETIVIMQITSKETVEVEGQYYLLGIS